MSCLRMTLHGKNELATGNLSFLLQSLTVLLPFSLSAPLLSVTETAKSQLWVTEEKIHDQCHSAGLPLHFKTD